MAIEHEYELDDADAVEEDDATADEEWERLKAEAAAHDNDYSHEYNYGDGVRPMQAEDFKARFLELMDEVAKTGEVIHLTKNGHPIAKFVPNRKPRKAPWGMYPIKIRGDIISPLFVEVQEGDDPYRIVTPDR